MTDLVLPGQPLAIRAAVWNKLVGLTRTPQLQGARPLPDRLVPTATVLVKNNTGGDLAAMKVGKIVGELLDTVNDPLQFQARPVYSINTPGGATDPFVILLEPIKNGEIGKAAIQGVAVCDVDFGSASDPFCSPGATSANLVSGTTGQARVLTKQSGTGVKRATVLLGAGSSAGATIRGTLNADLNQGSSASITVSGSGGTVTVYDIILPTGKKVDSGKTVVAYYDANDNRWNVVAVQLKTFTVMTDGTFDVDTCVFTKTTDTIVIPDVT